MSSEQNSGEIPESVDWKVKAEEAMREWNAQFYMWKMFDKSQLKLIKSFVGLVLFGKPESLECDESFNLDIDVIETLFNKYDEKKGKIIDEIFNQFQFDDNKLSLSHTVLYLSKCDWKICVFRQIRPDSEVNFIDFNGRVYESWKDFVETNKLPKCEYMAPKHGIHDRLSDEFEVHESPTSSNLEQVCDWIASGATATAIGLSVFAAAPTVALVLGGGGAVYGVRQSWYTLIDRRNHRQSIAPTNLESAGCYMNVCTTAVCGASTVALMKSASILKLSGKYSSLASKIILGMNYTAAASVVSNFGLYLYSMQQKLRNGEFSLSDVVDLTINLFLIYGTVSNVRQMRNYLSTLEANPTTLPKGLSKGARRRWRKRQAKLVTANSTLENQDMTKVGAWDPEISNFIMGGSCAIGKILSFNYCPDLTEIYDEILIIIKAFRRFSSNEITLEDFIGNLYIHGLNLYNLLRSNSREIQNTIEEILQRCGIIAAPESIPDLSNIIDDGTIAINNVGEEISREDGLPSEPVSSTNGKPTYEIILDLVEYRVCRKQFNEVLDDEELLAAFVEELSYVTIEIKSRITQQYEDMFSHNIKLMGEKKAKLVFSQIGVNSKNDFASKTFHQTIENLKTGDPVGVSITFKKQLDKIFSLYRELFLLIAGEDDISSIRILETCEILNKSVKVVMQPIISCYKIGKEIYEVNVKFFGHETAMVFVLSALNLNDEPLNYKNYDELLFINVAKKTLNLSEILPQLLASEESCTESTESTTELNNEPVTFTDEFKMETLLSTCDFYVQRMQSSEMTKIYSFVTDKFVNHFQCLANQQNSTTEIANKLKSNIDILGKNNFNLMCRFLYESHQMDIFNRTAEMFRKEDFVVELIAEYYEKMHDITNFHAEHLKHLMADDGVTVYTFKVENRGDIEEFKQQAVNLFNLDKSNINVVKEAENLIVLRNADKYVVFQFVKNETETLIMQIDLSKKNEENE